VINAAGGEATPAFTFPTPDLAEFFRTYVITAFDVDDEERRVVFATNLGGEHYNLWGMDLGGPAYPYPLTHRDQVPRDIRLDPQGRYIMVAFDTNGDELTDLYLVPPGGGTEQPLVVEPGHRVMNPVVSRDGNRVYYTTDRDEPRFLSIHRRDLLGGGETVVLTGTDAPTVAAAVAPDDSSLLVAKAYVNTHQPAFLLPLDSPGGTLTPLVPDPTVPHRVADAAYLNPDELVFTTDYGSDRAYVAHFSRRTGQFREIKHFDQPAGGMALHRESRTAYIVVERGVEDALYRLNLDTGDAVREELPVGVVEGMAVKDSGTLYLLGRSETEPMNLWRRRPGQAWTKLTANRVMGMAPEDLVPAEVVRYPVGDGQDPIEIEALWFQARPEVSNGYTIVWPHGGPQAAERRMFRAFFQFALVRGYSVFAPNFRGSSGYGARFMALVNRDWAGAPRRDMLSGIDWLVKTGRAHPEKLFCVGGSYGGYMTLLLHALHADRFKAFVDIFGPSNLVTFANSAPAFWRPMMKEWLGDPEDPADARRMREESPITYVDRMRKPMLVIQGANDPRVVRAESDQVVEALRSRGVEVQYRVFDDEGHGFLHKSNEIEAYSLVIDFLDRQRGA
jgi:dipeptidyl aminopeptidase/acylaminoacyl peptidase